MKSAINGTNRPSTNDVLEQLLKVINHNFNFHKKVSVNMELMQSNAARMATYGILIGIPQLVLMLLANIETATKSDYGREFCSAMHAIRKKYTYNHMHNATLLQFILKELVGADGVRVLKDAPALGTGTVHLVAKSVSYLQAMMGKDTDSVHTKSVYGVSSDSDSSEEERKPRARKRKKSQCSKSRSGRGKKKKDKDNEPKNNTCPHCKKFHRKKPHQVEPDKCMWNKKYKGYRLKLICNKLKVAFKPRHKFAAKLGGYASKGNKSGDDRLCAGMPEDGENHDKWITVTGNSKTKNLLNPKPKPKLHNAPPPTTTCPALHNKWMTTKPSCPQAHESTAGSKKMPSAGTSSKHYSAYTKVTICSLTTVSPKPRMNAQPLPRTTPTMQSAWQLILPMHNATNLLSGSPNADKIRPTAWVQHSIKPSKSLPRKNMSVSPNRTKSTYSMPHQPLVSC